MDALIFPVIAVNENFQVIRLNQAALDRSDQKNFPEALKHYCYEILYGRKNICPYCPFSPENQTQPDGEVHERIIQSAGANNEEKTLRLLFHRIKSERLYFVETIEDITKQRERQEEMVRMEKLAALGTMVSGIAHELNNPLTGIGLTLQNLAANAKTMTSEEIQKRMHMLQKDLDRASRIVSDILTFARPGEINLTPGDVIHIIQRAIATIQRLYPVLSRRVEWKLEGEQEAITYIHPEKLERVFINLFRNSIQALDYASGHIRVDIKKTVKWIHVIVEDDAGGIGAEEIDKIFHPFFSKSEDKRGTGLGLSICHSIITQHKGKIRVRSFENQTKFYLSLPASHE